MTVLDCINVPTSVKSNPSIAGVGVLLSFVITSGATILISSLVIFKEARDDKARVARRILLSLSDQQIITGIGLQGLGLKDIKSLAPYHFFILWLLSLLSTITHINTLFALINDFKRDWFMRWLRQSFVLVNLMLSVLYGFFFLMVIIKDLEPTLPIACVWEVPSTSRLALHDLWVSIMGTVAVIAAQAFFFILSVWYVHNNKELHRISSIQTIGLIAFNAVAIGAAVRIFRASDAFGTPSVSISDNQEQVWDIGQLLSTALLVLIPLITAIDLIREEDKHKDPERTPLIKSKSSVITTNRNWPAPRTPKSSESNLFYGPRSGPVQRIRN